MQQPEVELLNIHEAARMFRIKCSTLRKWLHEGRLPYVKMGSRVFLRKSDAVAFVEAAVISPTEEMGSRSKRSSTSGGAEIVERSGE